MDGCGFEWVKHGVVSGRAERTVRAESRSLERVRAYDEAALTALGTTVTKGAIVNQRV